MGGGVTLFLLYPETHEPVGGVEYVWSQGRETSLLSRKKTLLSLEANLPYISFLTTYPDGCWLSPLCFPGARRPGEEKTIVIEAKNCIIITKTQHAWLC